MLCLILSFDAWRDTANVICKFSESKSYILSTIPQVESVICLCPKCNPFSWFNKCINRITLS